MGNIVTDAVAAILGVRKSREQVAAQLTEQYTERDRLNSLPPHFDDYVAHFNDSLDKMVAERERRDLAWIATPEAKATAVAELLPNREPASLLALPSSNPGFHPLLPTVSGMFDGVSLHALTWLLAPMIRERIPEYVARVYPESREVMSPKERRAKLAKVEREITRLETELSDIDAALGEMRRVG